MGPAFARAGLDQLCVLPSVRLTHLGLASGAISGRHAARIHQMAPLAEGLSDLRAAAEIGTQTFGCGPIPQLGVQLLE